MRLALPTLCFAVVVSSGFAGGSAFAGPALDDDAQKPSPTSEAQTPDCAKDAADPRCSGATSTSQDGVEYGIGLRGRSVWVPKGVLELFLTRAAGGAHNYGAGLELTRRRGTTELQLGFEYERVTVGEGVWINKGDDVSRGDEADYVLSPEHSGKHLGWFTIEFTFLNHAEVTKVLSVRYGGGIGLGILTGALEHNNVFCNGATNSQPEPGCVPPRFNGDAEYAEGTETQVAYELPPVFPVVNAILGLQIKPTDKLTINIEGGIRTLPFAGISTTYFF